MVYINVFFSFQSLGNHELDEGEDGLTPFIKNLTSPVLAANLILTKVPALQNEPNLYKSVTLSKNGIKIGIIGYLTPETKFLAPKNYVEYEDEVVALRKEVFKLKEKKVNIIIALGHSGILKDLEIAKEVDEVDLVIGGHTNTFLTNTNETNEIPEIPQGPYPIIVEQASGRKVPVVQAYAYTKYLGKLHLIFDNTGEIIKYDGNPILLNHDIPNDPEILKLIEKYRFNVNLISNEVVGSSMVYLDGDQCRLRECNLGDFINDAIVAYTMQLSNEYSNIIALTQGGRIRTSLNRPEKPFELTRGDWITVIPFSDMLNVVTMNGSVLMQALEHSVDSWRTIDTPGQFLQFSGMRVIYNLAKPPGTRVQNALAMCSNCTELTEIRDEFEYRLIMSAFLADCGDGYSMFNGLQKEVLSYSENTCILDYLAKHSPINPIKDGRILLLNEDKAEISLDSIKSNVNISANKFLSSMGTSIQSNVQLCFVLLCLLLLHYH